MTRINTNVSSLIAQRVLGQNNSALTNSLERLSTGLRINRGKDDPAGLIASENLRSEIGAINAAIGNAERADQVVNIAEGGLNEVSGLLNQLQALVTTTANTAGLSNEERDANQLQVDSILQTIDRIASATSFQGKKLLNGSLDYVTSNVAGAVDSFKVNAAKLGFKDTLDVDVIVTASAQVGGFVLSFGAAAPTGGIDLAAASSQFIIEITGSLGSRELSFASGTSINDISSAINSFTDVTGVKAVTSTNGSLRLETSDFGDDHFVSVKVIDDGGSAGNGVYNLSAGSTLIADTSSASAFNTITTKLTDFGQDVKATVNGIVATTRGTQVSINTDFLDVEIDLGWDTGGGTANAAIVGSLDAFKIVGGGADFQLAPDVNIVGKVGIGIGNIAVRELGTSTVEVNDGSGGTTTQTYSLSDMIAGQDLNLSDGNVGAAQEVIDKAIREVSSLRGRLGAFQANTVGATIRSLNVSLENTSAAESVIRDADFAVETAELTRSQILVQAAQTTLGLANTQPQAALQLLG